MSKKNSKNLLLLLLFSVVLIIYIFINNGGDSNRNITQLLPPTSVNTSSPSVNPKIIFDDEEYIFQSSDKTPSGDVYVNQYCKIDEDASNWTKKIVVIEYSNMVSPISIARSIEGNIKNANSQASAYVSETSDGNVAYVDYLTLGQSKEANQMNVLEFSAYKLQKIPGNGVIALQFIKRYSVEDANSNFANIFNQDREIIMSDIANIPIPAIVK